MRNLIENRIDDKLINEIKELRKLVQEIRSRQISGFDALAVDTMAITASFTLPGVTNTGITITFRNPDNTRRIAIPNFSFFEDSVALENDIEFGDNIVGNYEVRYIPQYYNILLSDATAQIQCVVSNNDATPRSIEFRASILLIKTDETFTVD